MLDFPGLLRLTFPKLTKTLCLVGQTLIARQVKPVNDNPEGLEILTSDEVLLGQPVVAEILKLDSVRHVECHKLTTR